jgi:hypothetical protein
MMGQVEVVTALIDLCSSLMSSEVAGTGLAWEEAWKMVA